MSRWEVDLGPWQRGTAAALLIANFWTLLYFFVLLGPVWWPQQHTMLLFLSGAVVLGILNRGLSRRFWPAAAGVALGIALGGGEAWITDTIKTPLQQIVLAWRGMSPLPEYLLLASSAGWAAGNWLASHWQRARPARAEESGRRTGA